ncbi:transposase [Candidatus Kaiserbacteria bacterium]|nr:transposase [Candidatus Kaiserbacteria bacterium]
MNRVPFAEGEWYHCYNRGIDKRIVFCDERDYIRFLELLYLANSDGTLDLRAIRRSVIAETLSIPRQTLLVDIGAFCLMPNHFHLLIYEHTEGGITKFMRKLGTAYTMYFNIRQKRTGNLFNKPFRSRHIDSDRYLNYGAQYLYCNPAELMEPGWKDGDVTDEESLFEYVERYPYSSLGAFSSPDHSLRNILGPSIFKTAEYFEPRDMLKNALAYYRESAELQR